MKALPTLLLAVLVTPMTIHAEVSLCNGVWTSKPCTSTPASQPHTTDIKKDGTLPERRRLFTEVDLEAFRARRDGRGDISISGARDVCIGEKPSLDLCRKETSSILEKLYNLKRDIENKKAESEKIAEQNKNDSAKEENHVTIINNTTNFNIHGRSDKAPHIRTTVPQPTAVPGPNDFRIK